MSKRFLGLISGTSIDGVDAVIAEFGDRQCSIVGARTYAYPRAIGERLRNLIDKPSATLEEIGALDVAVGRFFGDCALALIRDAGLSARDVEAIGHHGQTVFHKPEEPEPFTMQLGDPNSVAAITGIPTVADLRGADIALGGQGAPLVPAFHEWLFADDRRARVILNIGGIANVTVLVPGSATTGFDTGPGNTLMDAWIRSRHGEPFDDGGRWAQAGETVLPLLATLLTDDYFALAAPKSTGREHFNMGWLTQHIEKLPQPPADVDVQATLAELTTETIGAAVEDLGLENFDLFVCGGGAHNEHLLRGIGERLETPVSTTAELGLDPDWVEATAFAWLARARLREEPGNVPSVTGARQAAVLGGLYYGSTG